MDLGLTGRRAIVTGASRGIGLVIAENLAREGCAVALCARGEQGLSKAAARLGELGAAVYTEVVDVAEPAAVRRFVEQAAAALGGLDIVVSNASPGSLKGDDAWVTSTRGDLQAFAVLAEAAHPVLTASDQAAIVAISSTSALDTGFPSGPTSFAAIKAAVLHHAAALAQKYAADGIRVNTVTPGPVLFEDGAWDQVRKARPEVFENLLQKVPRGRLGRPEDVADAVAFLVSSRADFCTGTNLVVDGGLLTRVQY